MSRRTSSIEASYFDEKYAADPDPWQFETSSYEDAKYAATLAALPRDHYATALEIGCSIGVLTARLAARCDTLLAIDVADAALAQARRRCAALTNVSFARLTVPAEWPNGSFDLVMLSEVVYYLDAQDVRRLVDRLRTSVVPGGDIVLVHWTGVTDYPLSGDEAVEHVQAALGNDAVIVKAERAEAYRLDIFRLT